MMKIICILFYVLIIQLPVLEAQQLYESYEIKKAIEKNTRSREGEPGKDYWQNYTDYHIVSEFNPKSGVVSGSVNVQYFNQSPDTLNMLVFKLMQNMYALAARRIEKIDTINLHKGISVESVKFNSMPVADSSINIKNTNLFIHLMDGILPGNSCNVSMTFQIPLPKLSQLRTGAYDSTSYFAGYWFPQVAVYDDIFGWDVYDYLGNAEGYNDFANYDVEITVPENYVVWATGDLLNEKELFTDEILQNIQLSKTTTDSVIHIITPQHLKEKNILKTNDSYTWKFKAIQVPDFAWATSDHYVWDACITGNPDAENSCWVQSAYKAEKKEFAQSTEIAKKSIEFFATTFPGIPYPYNKHISFNARIGGGMEFPMIANNGHSLDTMYVHILTAHEIAHNYFPFSMGINEHKFGWFDEMMTTLMHTKFLNQTDDGKYAEQLIDRNKKSTANYSAKNWDMPLITETENIIKNEPWYLNGYYKSLNMLLALETILGEENFKMYLQQFMKTWEGKHPSPHDFFYTINNISGKNLNWFWQKWVFENSYPDLALNMDNTTLKIINQGGQPLPFTLKITYRNDKSEEMKYNAGVWETARIVKYIPEKMNKIKSVEVFGAFYPDVYPEDNLITN